MLTLVYLVHGVDGHHDQHMHNVMRVQVEVDQAGEPLFGYSHSTNSTAQYGDAILKRGKRMFVRDLY